MPIQPQVSQTTTNFTGNGTVNPLKLFIPNMDQFDPPTQAAMLQIQQYINNLNAPVTPVPPVIVADVAWVAQESNNAIQAINTRSGMTVATITTAPGGAFISEPIAVALTIDGHYLYAIENGTPLVDVIDTTSATCIDQITMPRVAGGVGLGLALAPSPDGTIMYAMSRPTSSFAGITAINIADNSLGLTYHASDTISGVAVSPDSSTVYTLDNSAFRFYIIAAATMTAVSHFSLVAGNMRGLVLSNDGSTAYTGEGGNILVIDIAGASYTSVSTAGSSGGIVGAKSRLGQYIYCLTAVGTLDVLATATNTVIASVALGFNGSGCYPNSDDSLVWISGASSSIQSVITGSWVLGPSIPYASGSAGDGIAVTF